MAAERPCCRCRRVLPPEGFHRGNGPDGRSRQCKSCESDRKKAFRKAQKLRGPSALTEKTCIVCEDRKSVAEFRVSTANRSGYEPRCNDCIAARSRERNYGISDDEYQSLLTRQGGLCAICRREETCLANNGRLIKSLAVDHDHETGEVRGLLCTNCNKSLGCMGDDPDRLMAAAAYLLSRMNLLAVNDGR